MSLGRCTQIYFGNWPGRPLASATGKLVMGNLNLLLLFYLLPDLEISSDVPPEVPAGIGPGQSSRCNSSTNSLRDQEAEEAGGH